MANGDSVEFVLIECERWIGQSGDINGSAISISILLLLLLLVAKILTRSHSDTQLE